MAHFAELDENNVVLRVIVVNNEDCLDTNGNESEEVGSAFCTELLGGRWVQTSYNSTMRHNFAGIGFIYDEDSNAFIPPKPFASWVLTEQFRWQPPVERPEGGRYEWDESIKNWVELTVE